MATVWLQPVLKSQGVTMGKRRGSGEGAVYQRAGRTMTHAAEQKMAEWHTHNEQGRFGKHEYSLEEFGLSEASIDEAFAEYTGRFIDR